MSTDSLDIAVAPGEDRVVTISVTGEIDLPHARDLVVALRKVIADEPMVISLDLSGVTFMDSTGIQVLMGARADAVRAGTAMRIQKTSAQVQRVLQLTGLLETFEA
jgi:anti-sigma B factor antagonist